jgi:hypothetical protein
MKLTTILNMTVQNLGFCLPLGNIKKNADDSNAATLSISTQKHSSPNPYDTPKYASATSNKAIIDIKSPQF